MKFASLVLALIDAKSLLMFLLIIPIPASAYGLTVRDARFVAVIQARASKCPRTRNHGFSGADSYSP